MLEKFEPSPDFVCRTMRKVYDHERGKTRLLERIAWSRLVRYALTGGGMLLGILKAAPAF